MRWLEANLHCDPFGKVEKLLMQLQDSKWCIRVCACKNGTDIGHMTCAQTFELIRKATSIDCKQYAPPAL